MQVGDHTPTPKPVLKKRKFVPVKSFDDVAKLADAHLQQEQEKQKPAKPDQVEENFDDALESALDGTENPDEACKKVDQLLREQLTSWLRKRQDKLSSEEARKLMAKLQKIEESVNRLLLLEEAVGRVESQLATSWRRMALRGTIYLLTAWWRGVCLLVNLVRWSVDSIVQAVQQRQRERQARKAKAELDSFMVPEDESGK